MKHAGLAVFWFIIGVFCTVRIPIPGQDPIVIPPVPANECQGTTIVISKEDSAPRSEKRDHLHKPPRTRMEPRRGQAAMPAGQLVSFWNAWDKCKGETCID